MKKIYTLIVSLLLCGVFATTQAHAKNNILFILDGSNSMWGQVEGEAKITSAQNVMSDLIKDLPAETNAGFMVYGHREEAACDDIEVLAGVGEVSADELIGKIKALKPKGKTPVAASLKKSLDVLSKFEGDNNNVVLISDGIETCDGDPCAAAKALADAGINARVHVVGFDIGEKERAQLNCIPEMGNGKYFNASNASELKVAVAEVKEAAVAEPEPEPEPEPKITTYFEDNFDGEELSDSWEIMNPDPDGFIVEEGLLTVVTLSETLINANADLTNIFKLTKPLPKGDWTATMRFKPEVGTFREIFGLGLYTDLQNMLIATTGSRNVCCGNQSVLNLWGEKFSKGKKANFHKEMLRSPNLGGAFSTHKTAYLDWAHNNLRAVEMRIQKTGRSYIVSARVEGDMSDAQGTSNQWTELQKLTSVRSPGKNLVMFFTQTPDHHGSYNVKGGEFITNIDWVKIEAEGSGSE